MRYGRLMAVAIVFVSFPFAAPAFAQQKTKQYLKWEYKIVNSCNTEDRKIDIQQLGEEGWELVSIDASNCMINYFKRPKGPDYKQVVKAPAEEPTAPQCALPLDKAPAIRGLRLGMSAEETLSLFPSNTSKVRAQDAIKNAGSYPNYGLASFTLFPSSDDGKEVQEKFAGVSSFNFKALDGRVVEIHAGYRFNTPSSWWTEDEWIAKLSNAFDLPGPANWVWSRATYRRTLKCKEFEVVARVDSALNLTVTDPTYRRVVEQRAKSDREKKQREFAP